MASIKITSNRCTALVEEVENGWSWRAECGTTSDFTSESVGELVMDATVHVDHRCVAGPRPILYFVSFVASGGAVGNSQIQLTLPIRDIRDVQFAAKALGQPGAVITGWRRFEEN